MTIAWVASFALAAYAIGLLRRVLGAILVLVEIVLDDDFQDCECEDDECCDLCMLPADDDGFELGSDDASRFRGIVQALGDLDEDMGNA